MPAIMPSQISPKDSTPIEADMILGDNFKFSTWDAIALCEEEKCGYKSPEIPACIGQVQDVEYALPCWPCIVGTGCRLVSGSGCKTKDITCQKQGGFYLCCANASAFPPDASVPCGCALCGCCNAKDVTLHGMGLDFKNDTSCHSVCCCSHYALYTKCPQCCGVHSSGECLCQKAVMHVGLQPILGQFIGKQELCCVNSQSTTCPKPCWPYCMYREEPICC